MAAKKKKKTTAIAKRPKRRAAMVYRKAAPVVRRGASATVKAALAEKHRLIAIGGAALLAALQSRGVKIPHVKMLGTPGTMGVAAYVMAKVTKNQVISHLATGFLSVAAYQLTAKAMLPKALTAAQIAAAKKKAALKGYDEEDEFFLDGEDNEPIIIPTDLEDEGTI